MSMEMQIAQKNTKINYYQHLVEVVQSMQNQGICLHIYELKTIDECEYMHAAAVVTSVTWKAYLKNHIFH